MLKVPSSKGYQEDSIGLALGENKVIYERGLSLEFWPETHTQ